MKNEEKLQVTKARFLKRDLESWFPPLFAMGLAGFWPLKKSGVKSYGTNSGFGRL